MLSASELAPGVAIVMILYAGNLVVADWLEWLCGIVKEIHFCCQVLSY